MFSLRSRHIRCMNSSFVKSGHQRVVVTGLGLVTCLGVGVKHVWQNLCSGKSGIVAIPETDGYSSLPCRVAGFVPRGDRDGQLDVGKHFAASELRNLPTSTGFALIAADEAIKDSGLNITPELSHRAGVAIGTGMPDLEFISDNGHILKSHGVKKISPHFIPNILLNMASGTISMKYQLKGPNHTVSTACSTGLVAIGDAMNFIRRGTADIMVAGATEACIGPLSLAGFSRLRALSTNFNDTPQEASRPFDQDRDGFVMSEGAGVIILESLESAQKRDARIYCEVLGYGLTGDAFHVTSPREDGSGAIASMRAAIKDGDVDLSSVGYINAHATSTPIGDLIEIRAVRELFGKHSANLMISSNKGSIGHLQGAAGAVEAIITIISTYSGIVSPTINLNNYDRENTLNCTPNKQMDWNSERRISLTNSFGFWGSNSTLCFGQI